METAISFIVKKNDLSTHQFVHSEINEATLQEGEVLLRVDKFAFTANNITYAVLGERIGYWHFFPTQEEGWGTIPVWGYADVLQSKQPDIAVGTRIWGFYPLATHVVMQPKQMRRSGFTDGMAHRQPLPAFYNEYMYSPADHDPESENLRAIFFPLMATAFLIDDFMADNHFFAAKSVIISSASSKTGFGTAFFLTHHRSQRQPYSIIGLTSPGNLSFVEELGCYDKVISYDAIATLADEPVVYVDIAGSGTLRTALHEHFADNMKYSSGVGLSHWHDPASRKPLPGARPTVFFAPSQYNKRVEELGAAAFQKQLDEGWQTYQNFVRGKIEINQEQGESAIERLYLAMLAGQVAPNQAYMLAL